MTDKLHLRFQLHLSASDGHTYGYELTRGPDGPVVGHKSVYSPSARAKAKGEKLRTVYMLGDKEFVDDPKGLLAAYEQMLRDEAWAAAAPKEKSAEQGEQA
jgi:hypothetical protein